MSEQKSTVLTISQAYDAAFLFLCALFDQDGRNDDIAALLGGMQRLDDGDPAEKSYWVDWMHCYWQQLVANTTEKKQLFDDLITDSSKYVGTTNMGSWYAAILPDGQQIWANVWNGTFQYGGINEHPRVYDKQKGFSCIANP